MHWLTKVLNTIASEFVFQTMCLVGVRMLSLELLFFLVTNILYGVKQYANSLIPGVGDLLFFSPLEDNSNTME